MKACSTRLLLSDVSGEKQIQKKQGERDHSRVTCRRKLNKGLSMSLVFCARSIQARLISSKSNIMQCAM
jgi:hypothetical protein